MTTRGHMGGLKASLLLLLGAAAAAAASPAKEGAHSSYFVGDVEVVAGPSAEFDFKWLESPVWSEEGQYLLFSDVKWADSAGHTTGMIWKYDLEQGISPFLPRAGVVGPGPLPEDLADHLEAGPNGMIWGPGGYPSLLVAQHGMKRIVSFSVDDVVNGSIAADKVVVVADGHNGSALNSPNDLVMAGSGTVLFTDPPFGRQFFNDSSLDQAYERSAQPYTNVYALSPPLDGSVAPQLALHDIHRPNGIAVSSANKVFVARTDLDDPGYAMFDAPGGDVTQINRSSEKTFSMTHRIDPQVKSGMPALTDGMTASADGAVIFSSGPGGIYVLDGETGEEVAFVRIDDLVSNLEVGGGYLWATANKRLVRIMLATQATNATEADAQNSTESATENATAEETTTPPAPSAGGVVVTSAARHNHGGAMVGLMAVMACAAVIAWLH